MTQPTINQMTTKLRSHQEHGQAIVLFALGMVALIAAVGLATDAALLYKTKQDLQRTVDSAALAASYKLPNKTASRQAAYEFGRLHGYDFDPDTNPLLIDFPVYDPPRKAVSVTGATNFNFAFLGILGFHTMQVSAHGEAESAPMDVYLILDMSQSMVYDTKKPANWPSGSPCSTWDNNQYYDCIAKYCNQNRVCAPLDTSIKPAAIFFLHQLDPIYDRVGLVVYDQVGLKITGLTNDFTALETAINSVNAFDHQGSSNCDITRYPSYTNRACNKQTNVGDGIMFAHNGIAAEGRMDAVWSMILLTDGKANVYRQCSGCPPNCGGCEAYVHLCDECQKADDWAINNAKDTWTRHETTIYTIAYGDTSTTPEYQDLMKKIADWTDNGTFEGKTNNFWAAPDAASLQVAMQDIAQRIYSRLLR
jgi:hypothetical protein